MKDIQINSLDSVKQNELKCRGKDKKDTISLELSEKILCLVRDGRK
jgi:hypothetical protein